MNQTIESNRYRSGKEAVRLFNTKEWYAVECNAFVKTHLRHCYTEQSKPEVVYITFKQDESVLVNYHDFELSFPSTLSDLAREINDSKFLMELEENWDDEGGLPIEVETWKRAVLLVHNYAIWLYDQYKFVVLPPQINPGPYSSIDLLWRNEKFRLLVNISAIAEKPIEYYGDNTLGENSIKGNLKSGAIQEFFALWLKDLMK